MGCEGTDEQCCDAVMGRNLVFIISFLLVVRNTLQKVEERMGDGVVVF